MPPIPRIPVSGRYRGAAGSFQVELRIDVDGPRAMQRVSADYYEVRGAKQVYVGSMRLDRADVAISPASVTIRGRPLFSWSTPAEYVRVTIPRVDPGSRPANATLRHFTAHGEPLVSYPCAFESEFFRSVLLEEACERGVQPFRSYATDSLPSGGRARTLTYASAFREAGIEIVSGYENHPIAMPAVSENVSWSDAELHAAMQLRFAAWANIPQWAIWLLHARLHDNDLRAGPEGPKLFGLMFDQRDRQRQGCAVFYQGMAGSSPARQRIQLYTCVHELGHGFNLLHSWQKSLATPPVPSRPRSATWMAYPDVYPGGEPEFWPAFEFEFDDQEVIHLRHALREDVIMGGNAFGAGAAFQRDAEWEKVQRLDPGLRLVLEAPRTLPFGLPVTVDYALWGTTPQGRCAPRVLGPRPGNLDIAIRRPGTRPFVFEPLLHHCRANDAITLRAGDAPVRDSAFIHYGKDGFAFDRPGLYEIRARCTTPDGAIVLSNVARIRVRPAVSRADRDVARLVFGHEQGTLMSLVGSDAPALQRGRDALDAVIERHPSHPVARVARVIRATNLAREFKTVRLDGSVKVRPSQPAEVVSLLREVLGPRALREAVASADEGTATARVLAVLSTRVQTTPSVESDRASFIRSRSGEIATVVPAAVRSARSSLTRGRPGAKPTAPIPSRRIATPIDKPTQSAA